MNMFNKSTRKSVKIKVAVTGPSGSGKTFSALRLAAGLGKKIALIDTENGSASLYSEQFDFDVVELRPPYTPDKYISAIKEAEKLKYDVLIIDSLSHEWEGEGGILQTKEQMDQKGGNSFTNWGKMTKPHNHFTAAYLHADINIVATMRSKQDYVIEQNDRGKQIPKKIGLKPIQREGTEYEFTTIFDIDMAHDASVSKDRTGLFTDKTFKITEETGAEIKKWLNSVPLSASIAQKESNKTSAEIEQEAKKTLDIKSDFDTKKEFFINQIDKNISSFCDGMESSEVIFFRNQILNGFKDEYIKKFGDVDIAEYFLKRLLAKNIRDKVAIFNTENNMKYSENAMAELRKKVWDKMLANPHANLDDVFLAETALLPPF